MKNLITTLVVAFGSLTAYADTSTLFIGNSFTYAYGSAAKFYRANSVTDLNNEGIGGVPALFKSFTDQAGLDYDVYLETRGGSGLDFHLENKLPVVWDFIFQGSLEQKHYQMILYHQL
jgi:hypothetical protein